MFDSKQLKLNANNNRNINNNNYTEKEGKNNIINNNKNEIRNNNEYKDDNNNDNDNNNNDEELPLITLNFISICQCCKTYFDNNTYLPYLLKYSHLFCIKCINEYFTDKNGIKCPSLGLIAKSTDEFNPYNQNNANNPYNRNSITNAYNRNSVRNPYDTNNANSQYRHTRTMTMQPVKSNYNNLNNNNNFPKNNSYNPYS